MCRPVNVRVCMAQRLESTTAYPGRISPTSKSEVMCLMTFLGVQATGEKQRGYRIFRTDRMNVTAVMESLSL